jgi:hypothetical protein
MTAVGRLVRLGTPAFLLAVTGIALPASDDAYATPNADASRSLAMIHPDLRTKPKPNPKPKAQVKLKKWGVTVEASRQVSRKLKRQPNPPRSTQVVSNERGRQQQRDRVPTDGARLRPFRLNIGICGRIGPDGIVPGPTRCQPFVPTTPDLNKPRPTTVVVRPPRPSDVTSEQILTQYKDVLFAQLRVKVQPAGRTLVNLDTIVYTDQSKVSMVTVSLLGFPIVLEATPMSYSWNFGDGRPALTTTSPGKPYPSKEVTHRYMKRGSANVWVTTNYAARFNVAGTGWQYVDGTVPITGPATALLIREAVPVLVDPAR